MVPVVGLEPIRCCHQRILNPSRLPFHHTGVYDQGLDGIIHELETDGKPYDRNKFRKRHTISMEDVL